MLQKTHISIHTPKADKPKSFDALGHFLVGLIDGAGHINKLGYIVVCFHDKDISLAYYIKTMIGYGTVKKVQFKRCYTYVCSHPRGLSIWADLLRHKLKHSSKIDMYNQRLCPKLGCESSIYVSSNLLNDHWLAGFIQADGSFQIKYLRQTLRTEVRLVLQISQKKRFLLDLTQNVFGGSIGYRKSNDSYYYSTVGFNNAFQLINYLDHYQVMSSKLQSYWLWRKTYIYIQKGLHLTSIGLLKIQKKKLALTNLKKSPGFVLR